MDAYFALLAVICLERVAELVVSQRHAAASLARGATEYGRGHFPVMVALHFALIAGCWIEPLALHRAFIPALGYPMMVIVVAANALRWWCIATLGPRWSARVIVAPGEPLVRSVPLVRSPELRGGDHRGRGAAAGRVGLAHRDRLHGAERGAADRAGAVREPGAGRRRAGVIDVLVVGGGPAGLATAIRCAQAGLEVTVAEPRTAPIDKACGEGLMPAAVAGLDAIGVRPPGQPLRGIRYTDGQHRADGLFRAGPGLGVRRTALHAALAERAAGLGVGVLPARVTGFAAGGDRVTAAGVQARS